MTNLYQLNTSYRLTNCEAYIVQERINQLIHYYGKDNVKRVFTSGIEARVNLTLGDKGFLSIHIENLIKTYGLGLVSGIMRVTYDVEMEQKRNRIKAKKSKSSFQSNLPDDNGPKSA